MTEIDWMATSQLVLVVLGVLTLIAATAAAVPSWRSWRLQKRQHEASVGAQQISDGALLLLRQVEQHGEVSQARLGSRVFAPGNAANDWIGGSLNELKKRGLLVSDGQGTCRLTSDGRAVLRSKEGSSAQGRAIVFADGKP